MKLPVLDIVCAAMLGLAIAIPLENQEVPRQEENAPGIQCWSDPNFSGKFIHYTAPAIAFNICHVITGDFPPGTGGGLSSVAADSKNFCTLYPNTDCDPGDGSDNDRLWVEGSYYDLGEPEEGWGDRAQSFMCQPCPECGN